MKFEIVADNWTGIDLKSLPIKRNERLETVVVNWQNNQLTELPPRLGVPSCVMDFYSSGINHRIENGTLTKDYHYSEVTVEINEIYELEQILRGCGKYRARVNFNDMTIQL